MAKPVLDKTKRGWWESAVFYQIYPKSFQDTTGTGVGDLKGIISRLDYLEKLGIDGIWLSPVCASPQVDNGYDVSDYCAIDPMFGTMEDMDALIAEAKKRNISIIMDLVLNHCSDQHIWFREALKSRENPYHDYFIWRDGDASTPPNDMGSVFGGPAWTYVPHLGQWYFHQFVPQQPDMNWENPKVLQELYTMINWWMEKGVAGFRIDAIINIQKDLDFPSYAPDGADGLASVVRMVESVNGVGEKLQDLKKNTFAKYDAFTVGEVFNMKREELEAFVGENGHFSTMFDFSVNCLSDGPGGWYRNKTIAFDDFRRTLFQSQMECLDIGFLANIIENHDEPRGSSRFLPEYAQNEMGMKMLGTVSMLLRGLPFLYQGQEIGMTNCPMNSVEEYNDINTKSEYRLALEAGLSEEEALEACYRFSRDNARTPMQWDDSPHAGFTTGIPWLKVNPNYTSVNVALQEKKEDSILNFYRKLIALRKSEEFRELFTYGDFHPVLEEETEILAYCRSLGQKKVMVIANFGKESAVISDDFFGDCRCLLTNDTVRISENRLTLAPAQVVVLTK